MSSSYSPYIDVVKDDYGYQIVFEIRDTLNAPVDLSDVLEINLHVWRERHTVLEYSGVCSVVDSDLGTCFHVVASNAFSNPGRFQAELERSYTAKIVTDHGLNIRVYTDLPGDY